MMDAAEGVGAVLIGESLMRATDPAVFICQLLLLAFCRKRTGIPRCPSLKSAGIRSKEEAVACAQAGVDLLGLMFVENLKRHIDLDIATGDLTGYSFIALRRISFFLPSRHGHHQCSMVHNVCYTSLLGLLPTSSGRRKMLLSPRFSLRSPMPSSTWCSSTTPNLPTGLTIFLYQSFALSPSAMELELRA